MLFHSSVLFYIIMCFYCVFIVFSVDLFNWKMVLSKQCVGETECSHESVEG